MSQLSSADAQRLRERLHRLESACGCDAAAMTAFMALTIYVSLFFMAPDLVPASAWGSVGKGLVFFVGGGTIGKALARIRIGYLRCRIRRQLEANTLRQPPGQI
jgi:hypothetical protein